MHKVIRKTLLSVALSLLCIVPAIAAGRPATATQADLDAFNDTIAAGSSRGCESMSSAMPLLYPPPMRVDATGGVMNDPNGIPLGFWAQAATSAKVCEAAVHAETSDAAPMRLPKLVLADACSHIKANLAKSKDDLVASQSSWACGWPAPIPQLRTVPRE